MDVGQSEKISFLELRGRRERAAAPAEEGQAQLNAAHTKSKLRLVFKKK